MLHEEEKTEENLAQDPGASFKLVMGGERASPRSDGFLGEGGVAFRAAPLQRRRAIALA